jgi:MinD-like ATPase involved in chromosome partitioning or flagellar assembly
VTVGPEISLAGSAREWPNRVHRFLLDHGGGRVRSRVMGPEQAVRDQYDVLLIDDVCSFLTPRLVRNLRDLGREIVGVYSPADAPDAKRHLLECGISDVIEADAAAEEFLSVVAATLTHRGPVPPSVSQPPRSFRIGVFGPLGGVGATEVAIALAAGLSRPRSTLLIDLDQQNPSVAQRLDLPLHPNLLTAVDAAHHSTFKLAEAILLHDQLGIVGGIANPSGMQELPPVEIEGLLDELGEIGYEVLVADLGAVPPDRVDSIRLHALIAVGLASPVGMARLVRTVRSVLSRAEAPDTVAVVNRVGAGSRRRSEIRAEMARLMPEIPVALLPEDRRLDRAAWDGTHMARGQFARSVGRIASLIDEVAV